MTDSGSSTASSYRNGPARRQPRRRHEAGADQLPSVVGSDHAPSASIANLSTQLLFWPPLVAFLATL
jgi:hypothetical protein